MSSYRGVSMQARAARPRRPFGVALIGGLGVLGSLLLFLGTLAALWALMRITFEPSRQFGIYSLVAVLALIALWINWGFWDMVRSAWWANLGLMVVGAGLSGWALSRVSAAGDMLGLLMPRISAYRGTVALALVFGLLVYELCAIAYTISVHGLYGVGVKDERPLWEKVHRN